MENTDFTLSVPCFNVTSSDFVSGGDTTTVVPSATSTASSSDSDSSSSSGDGLSTGVKAGIAVGVIVASLAIVGVAAFAFLRGKKRTSNQTQQLQQEIAEVRKDADSV